MSTVISVCDKRPAGSSFCTPPATQDKAHTWQSTYTRVIEHTPGTNTPAPVVKAVEWRQGAGQEVHQNSKINL